MHQSNYNCQKRGVSIKISWMLSSTTRQVTKNLLIKWGHESWKRLEILPKKITEVFCTKMTLQTVFILLSLLKNLTLKLSRVHFWMWFTQERWRRFQISGKVLKPKTLSLHPKNHMYYPFALSSLIFHMYCM